jgi:chemotaxis protein MotB
MKLRLTLFALALGIVAGTGCGIKKETHQKALDEIASLQQQLDEAKQREDERTKRLAQLESDLASTQTERDSESAEKRTAREAAEKLAAEMQATVGELEELRKQREAADKRLAAFRQLQDRFRALVDTGKLDVGFRNGQMVLKLPSGILFASGSADLSKGGETALAEVLSVLEEFKDRRFVIAGHTDNEPIKTRKFPNNWALSSARALSVLEFMVDAGFDSKNLGAAGYGEFDPVAANDTPENKQLNRRIEIVLVPDLSELPNLAAEPN